MGRGSSASNWLIVCFGSSYVQVMTNPSPSMFIYGPDYRRSYTLPNVPSNGTSGPVLVLSCSADLTIADYVRWPKLYQIGLSWYKNMTQEDLPTDQRGGGGGGGAGRCFGS